MDGWICTFLTGLHIMGEEGSVIEISGTIPFQSDGLNWNGEE